MKLFQEERLNLMADFVNSNGNATIHRLARHFNISVPTVRRDLTELESRGIISRSHGGAVARNRVLEDITFEKRMRRSYGEKIRIARHAASLVREGDVVILDTGTTNYWIATLLKQKNITVITNSLKAAMELSANRNIKHILIGGNVLPGTFSTYGALAVEGVRKFNADKVFLGTTGIHPEKGLTEAYEEEAAVKRAFIEVSRKKIVVADSSKFCTVSFASVCGISEIDAIITDPGVEPVLKRKFGKTKTRMIYA